MVIKKTAILTNYHPNVDGFNTNCNSRTLPDMLSKSHILLYNSYIVYVFPFVHFKFTIRFEALHNVFFSAPFALLKKYEQNKNTSKVFTSQDKPVHITFLIAVQRINHTNRIVEHEQTAEKRVLARDESARRSGRKEETREMG